MGAGRPKHGCVRAVCFRIDPVFGVQIRGDVGERVAAVDVPDLVVVDRLEAVTALERVASVDPSQVVADTGDLFGEMVSNRAGAVERRNAGNHDLDAGGCDRVCDVRLVPVGVGCAEFVQQIRCECGEQLETGNVGPVAEIACHIERVLAAHGGVERVLVPEVVVADECLVLLADDPVQPEVEELRMLYSRRGCEQR